MSLKYEDSDSSLDDYVCIGPYTMEEAKRDVKKGKPRQLEKRHSSICRFRHYDSSEAIDTITAHFGQTTNISSNPSEYLTSNETVHTENSKSSDFLEKISKVINEPISGSTSYNTAFDQTDVHGNIGNIDSDQEEELNGSVITISDDSIDDFSQVNTSCNDRSPVAIHMGKDCQKLSDEYNRTDEMAVKQEVNSNNSSFDLENSTPDCNISPSRVAVETLNNESVIDNSDDEINLSNPHLILESEVQESNSLYSNISEELSDQKVVSQNSEYRERIDQSNVSPLVLENGTQGSSFSDHREGDQKDTEHRLNREIYYRNVIDKENYLYDSSDDLNVIYPTPQAKNEQACFGYNQLSKITEKTEFTTFSDRSASTTDVSENTPEIRESSTACSPVQIPSINMNQFDDSCDFDDTLEEMNRFLEQGAEYVMPEKTVIKKEDTCKMEQSMLDKDNYICAEETSKNIMSISGSFIKNSSQDSLALKTPSKKAVLADSKKYYSVEKVSKSTIPVKPSNTVAKSKFQHIESKIKSPSVFGKNLFTKTTPNPKSESAFKLPTKPAKKITPSKTSIPSLKNIVSPIGVYINSTPKYSPMKKVPQNKHSLKQESEYSLAGPSSYKENLPVDSNLGIPSVIYKPAKTKHTSEVREINLPDNIKKLIAPHLMTKHEQRIEGTDHNQSVDRRLLESDLSIDVSLLSNPDISILTNKQAYNTRKF